MNITKKNIAIFAKDESLNSYEFWKILNNIRKDRGASPVLHKDFIKRVADECDDLGGKEIFLHPQNNMEITSYKLNRDQMFLVGMRESKAVRKQVLKWLHELSDKVDEIEAQKAERAEASLSFKEQSAALKLSREFEGKETLSHHYSNEADLLNRVILGCTAKSYRSAHQLDKADSLRDTLTPVELEAYTALRKANETYLLDGLTHSERKEKLTNRYKRFYCQRLIEEYERLNG